MAMSQKRYSMVQGQAEYPFTLVPATLINISTQNRLYTVMYLEK